MENNKIDISILSHIPRYTLFSINVASSINNSNVYMRCNTGVISLDFEMFSNKPSVYIVDILNDNIYIELYEKRIPIKLVEEKLKTIQISNMNDSIIEEIINDGVFITFTKKDDEYYIPQVFKKSYDSFYKYNKEIECWDLIDIDTNIINYKDLDHKCYFNLA